MGVILLAVELQHGARGIGKKKSGVDLIDSTPTLSEIGITKDESSQTKFLAVLPDETFAARAAEVFFFPLPPDFRPSLCLSFAARAFLPVRRKRFSLCPTNFKEPA